MTTLAIIGDIQAKPDPKNVRRLMNGAAHVLRRQPAQNRGTTHALSVRRARYTMYDSRPLPDLHTLPW
jgi:hypothetical protein